MFQRVGSLLLAQSLDVRSIDFVDVGGTTGRSTAGEASTAWEGTAHIGGTTSLLVNSGHDGVEDILKSFLLGSVLLGFSFGVGLEPLVGLVNELLDVLLLIIGELVGELGVLEGVSNGVGVVLKSVLSVDLLSESLIFGLESLSLLDESVDISLGESALLVGDGDLVGLGSALISGGDVEDTILIDVEGDLNLGDTSGGGRDSVEVELSEEVVILGKLTFTFEDLDEDTRLVVGVGGESLGLLGGDGGVSRDENGHDLAGSLNSHGEGGNVEEENVLD